MVKYGNRKLERMERTHLVDAFTGNVTSFLQLQLFVAYVPKNLPVVPIRVPKLY